MRTDANQIAFDAVRSILAAAGPLSISVGGTAVEVAVNRRIPEPWPAPGIDGLTPQDTWPAAIEAVCRWPGGTCTLDVECVAQPRRTYRHNVILRVSCGRQWLLWTNAKNAI